jgi:hypothetical protein
MSLLTIKSENYNYEFVAADVEELIRWCYLQATFYKRIATSNGVHNNEYAFSDVRQKVQSITQLEAIAEKLKALADQPSEALSNHVASIQSICEQVFNETRLPPADSEIGLQLGAQIDIDPEVGYPALYSLSKISSHQHPFQANRPVLWRGIVLGAALFAQRSQEQKPQRYAKAVREWVSSAQSDLARTRKRAEETVRDLRSNVSDFKQKVTDFETQHASRIESAHQSTESLLSKARDEIEKFKLFVKSEIALKAPVTYWEVKAEEHERLARNLGIAVVLLMLVCGICAFYSLGFIKELVNAGDKTNYAGIAVVAVLLTLALWIVRLAVRLFLSQQHLGADARERTAMVKTYLALKEAGVAPNNGDLTPVLVALFRPSSDGIVKDEAMPPVLAEILTRTKN